MGEQLSLTMRVEAGEHQVVFRFRPRSLARGKQVTLASLALLLLLLGLSAAAERRSARSRSAAEPS